MRKALCMCVSKTNKELAWEMHAQTYTHKHIIRGNHMWQSQVENKHYSTVSGLIRLVISLECSIEITPNFLCPFMND